MTTKLEAELVSLSKLGGLTVRTNACPMKRACASPTRRSCPYLENGYLRNNKFTVSCHYPQDPILIDPTIIFWEEFAGPWTLKPPRELYCKVHNQLMPLQAFEHERYGVLHLHECPACKRYIVSAKDGIPPMLDVLTSQELLRKL